MKTQLTLIFFILILLGACKPQESKRQVKNDKSQVTENNSCSLSLDGTSEFQAGENRNLKINCSSLSSQLSYSWKIAGQTLPDHDNTLSLENFSVGSHVISASISDGFQIISLSTPITVKPFAAPLVCNISPEPNALNLLSSASILITATCNKSGATYKWYLDGQAIPGQTQTTLSISGSNISVSTHALTFEAISSMEKVTISKSVIVTNPASFATTPAQPSACSISAIPSSFSMISNESKTLSVSCMQGSSLNYAWTKNGSPLTDNTQNLVISGLTAGNHNYAVKVSNSVGSQTVAQSILVTPNALAPSGCALTAAPNNNSITAAESKTLSVSCTQGANLIYTWTKDGGVLPNSTPSLVLAGLTPGNYNYSVRVSNSAGSQTVGQHVSVKAVVVPPSGCSLASSPNNNSMTTTESKTLTINCTQGSNLTYSWFKNSVATGKSTNSIIVSGLAAGNYSFYATANNSAGSVSTTAFSITVQSNTTPPAPVSTVSNIAPSECYITALPAELTISTPQSKTLTVQCSQGNNLSYAWYKDNTLVPLQSFKDLHIFNPLVGIYSYYARVSNSSGSTATNNHTFTVTSSPVPSTGGHIPFSLNVGTTYGWGLFYNSFSNTFILNAMTMSGVNGNAQIGTKDSFLININGNGSGNLWTKQYGSPGMSTEPRGLAFDSSKNIYSTELKYNSSTFSNYLSKYNSDGVLQWSNHVETSKESYGGLSRPVIDSKENLYVAGSFSGSSVGIVAAGRVDVYIIKYNARNGSKQWTKSLGAKDGWTTVQNLNIDPAGNIYLTGTTSKALKTNTQIGLEDFYLAKFNSAGENLWTKQFSPNSCNANLDTNCYSNSISDLAVDSSSNIYIMGTTTIGVDTTPLVGFQDIFLTKYDTMGNKLWTKGVGIPGKYLQNGYSYLNVTSNTIYFPIRSSTAKGGTQYDDVYLAKYDSNYGSRVWLKTPKELGVNYISGGAMDSTNMYFLSGGNTITTIPLP